MHNAYADSHSSSTGYPSWSPESLQTAAVWAIAIVVCCLALFAITRGSAAGGETHTELFVISNPNIQITDREIKEAYAGTRQFIGSTRLIPVDNASAQASFLFSAMDMRASRYGVIWTKKSYREGMVPPAVKPNDDDVVDFVRRTPGAIGYVKLEPAGVNIVRRY